MQQAASTVKFVDATLWRVIIRKHKRTLEACLMAGRGGVLQANLVLPRWHPVLTGHELNESGAYYLPLSAAASIYLYHQPPSGESRLYHITHLRNDGIHCRESTGTVPTIFKVVPVKGAAFSGITMDQLMCVSLSPHPLMNV